ncbi:MAG: DUF1566 domain-containing protein [Nitrospinaceae bacterium]|jgi:hypothetical protein|nr:DUF1566 domain-containing protein [Nitrospina sp.]MBT5868068.1 DUF1566 domain-containing protein [Nitrospinaceae bacterium]MBT6345112.1 DUF1566 domain-containing protein [Nitrospina sp.]
MSEESTRFVEADDDTIIDGAKRLVWAKQDTWQMSKKWMNQRQIIEFAESLNRKRFAGFANWRLPTAEEAKSLFDKKQQNSDNMGKEIYLSTLFEPGCGFLCWTSDVRHNIQGIRLSFRKGVTMYDDIFRVSRGASRLVRDIEKDDS